MLTWGYFLLLLHIDIELGEGKKINKPYYWLTKYRLILLANSSVCLP